MSNYGTQIEEFQNNFKHLQVDFTTGTVSNIAIVSFRMSEKLRKIGRAHTQPHFLLRAEALIDLRTQLNPTSGGGSRDVHKYASLEHATI